LRYFNVYGPRQGSSQYANAIPVFFRNIKNKAQITVFGDGNQTRDFVNAKDVVNANILAAESNLTTGVFNIATGIPTSVNELLGHIIDITASKPERIIAPKRTGEVLHSLADITLANKCLGYNPTVNIKEGLIDYFNYYKKDIPVK
jgi:UDP-glucose 4-epimerase